MKVAAVLFPGITPLDLVGPIEVLRRVPNVEIGYVASDRSCIDVGGMIIEPTETFDQAVVADILLVPGGPGVNSGLTDTHLLAYLRALATHANIIASVCTGSLLLAAAGLLRDRRATTHWQSMDALATLGAIPVEERVVVDGSCVTGAGVSAGLDVALRVVELTVGREMAQLISLAIEYNPSTDGGPSARERYSYLVDAAREAAKDLLDERRRIVAVVAANEALRPENSRGAVGE